MQAELMWITPDAGGLKKMPVMEIARQLWPYVQEGLDQLGVDKDEQTHYLTIIEERLKTGINGAVWQRREFMRLSRKMNSAKALTAMVQNYMQYSAANTPVAQWSNRNDRG